MLRENYNNTGIVKEYKNNNITIKLYKDFLQDFIKDDLMYLAYLLSYIDCNFIGETYCLNNFETGHTVYNYYSDKIYIFPWRYLQDLKEGKTVRLYARTPDEYDRDYIKEGLPWWDRD